MKGRGAQLRKALGTAQQAALMRTLIGKREAAGLTQLQLAKKLGQYQSFVSRLESGQRRVDVIEFLQLAEILDFDPCRVLRGLTKLSDLG